MSSTAFKWLPVVVLVLGCQAPGAFAQPAPSAAELHANAVASFRQARFSEAYGRFIELANAGHAPSAELTLWMYLHGATLFGKDWDSTPEQLSTWAKLAGQPVPVMVGSAPAMGALERSFWTCDYAATHGRVDSGTAATCGGLSEALKQHKFGGDFNAMLAWWRQHKEAEHLALAEARSLSLTQHARSAYSAHAAPATPE